MTLTPDYLAAAEALLGAPSHLRTKTASARQLHAQVRAFLPRSRKASKDLRKTWQRSQIVGERNLAEVQLLAATATDLAIAQRLFVNESSAQMREESSAITTTILRGLTNPEMLLRPTRVMPHYRGADHDLLAAVYQVLTSIEEDAIETTSDAITSAMTLNAAILKEAAEITGVDLKKWKKEARIEELMAFLIEAWEKLSILVGAENISRAQEIGSEATEKLREKVAVTKYVNHFLKTDEIYQETRNLLAAYTGSDKALAKLSPQIRDLEGSFSGRNKLVALIVRLLALLKLAPPIRTSPFGPIGIGSAYLLVIGYELYTAHDHVDSDKFPFFDRVQGVHTLVEQTLKPKK
ncbi:MAG: hypothetical protein DSY55_06060 [Clostridia bacterium]|nr:MAG: hypothetical protein DSY55_06060 [Clostridia bacterium]